MSRFSPALLSLLVATSFSAAGPKWEEGDYGPVVSVAMAADGRKLGEKKQLALKDLGNFVFRARLISLNKEKTANVCFDTEMIRVAAAWEGGFVEWKGAYKNMGPAIKGKIHFGSQPRPGWSINGKWDDPRDPKEGPLPSSQAKYRGTYLHGTTVVLYYTVGDCRVLEMQLARKEGEEVCFARGLTLGKSSHPLSLLVCEEPRANGSVQGNVAKLAVNGETIYATAVGAPPGTRWEVIEGRIHLHFPALKGTTSVRVLIQRAKSRMPLLLGKMSKEKPEDLSAYTKGGPGRWPQVLTTQGAIAGDGGAYVVDDIPGPVDNPWKSWLRFGALDFFEDGRAAISTWDGDVWIVSGLDGGLRQVRWKRFATGLMQPLGLKIINGIVYTAGRDQVTRLHDLNGDGEADFYECFNNDAGLTPQRHEYVMDLQVDAKGNLYYCRSGHYTSSQKGENCCVIRLSPDGKKMEVIARGFREPNGMSIGPDGLMTVGDNEGNGIPQTPIYRLKEGGFYGFTPPGGKGKSGWKPGEKAIVWLPKTVDRSAGGQVRVTSDRWGPLKGELLHTSYGDCRLFHIMLDRVGETVQGFATRFPYLFTSGIMRARFHPKDGQLYLCGLRGWGTRAPKDGQFCRVRYTGEPYLRPVAMKATATGLEIQFAVPLDRKAAEDTENWGGESFDAFSVPGRKKKRKEDLEILKVGLSKDNRTVTLEIEDMAPATNLNLLYQIKSAKGKELEGEIWGTVHRLPGK